MKELREYARELLENEEVAVVIGYTQLSEKRTKPIIITDPADASKLVFNEYCLNNLAVYLTKVLIVMVLLKISDLISTERILRQNALPVIIISHYTLIKYSVK